MNKLSEATTHIQKKIPNIAGIYLYGSYGTEFERDESDLDLAILAKEKQDQVELWQLSQEIAAKINQDVQLVDLKQSSTVFIFEIVTSGMRIYCQDPLVCDQFEQNAISMYLRFNEERKEILEDLKNG